MSKIEVFDPALCCSTGVCGPTPDSQLTAFASLVETLKGQGHQIERHNLAHEPLAFVQNAEVKALLEKETDACLPLVFIDGKLAFRSSYPTQDQIANRLSGAESDPKPIFAKASGPQISLRQQSGCDGSTDCC